MGLREELAITNLDFGLSEGRIRGTYGKVIKIEIDAESFLEDMVAIMHADSKGAEVVSHAIAYICDSEMGKEAFELKGITKIVLKNQPKGSRSITMDNGVITLSCAFAMQEDCFSECEASEILENQL